MIVILQISFSHLGENPDYPAYYNKEVEEQRLFIQAMRNNSPEAAEGEAKAED